MEGIQIDGNNIIDVFNAIKTSRKNILNGSGPILIEAMTFRIRGHEEASGIKYVPKELIERPKQGFGIPLGDWLRGPLKEWAYDLIYNTDYDDGVIDKKSIKKTFNEHIENKRNWQNKIWTVLVYINWRKNNFN